MHALMTNDPSPRPGFTYVARAHARRESNPVVAVVSEDPLSLTALRQGAFEASLRCADLHVVDVSDSTGFERTSPSGQVEDDEQAETLSTLEMSNVTISHVDLSDREEDLSDYCERVHADLLVIDSSLFALAVERGEAMGSRDAAAPCDVLIVAPSQQTSEPTRLQ